MKRLAVVAMVGLVAACSGPETVPASKILEGCEAKPLHEKDAAGMDGRFSEAHSTLTAMRDRARVVLERRADYETALSFTELGLGETEVDGRYFKMSDYFVAGKPRELVLTCRNVFSDRPRDLILTADMVTNTGSFNRKPDAGYYIRRESEARAGIGVIKDRARAVYARSGTAALSFSDLEIGENELDGIHFETWHYSISIGSTVEAFKISCWQVFEDKPNVLELTCNLKTGNCKFNR